MTNPTNTERKQIKGRFQPGQSGNPKGKAPGTRHRYVMAAEALLDGEAEKLTRRAIEAALNGDMTALRLCLERIVPPRRDRPVMFEFPKIESAKDASSAAASLVEAVAAGDLTPTEAGDLAKLLDVYTRVLEATDFEDRLAKLEGRG